MRRKSEEFVEVQSIDDVSDTHLSNKVDREKV